MTAHSHSQGTRVLGTVPSCPLRVSTSGQADYCLVWRWRMSILLSGTVATIPLVKREIHKGYGLWHNPGITKTLLRKPNYCSTRLIKHVLRVATIVQTSHCWLYHIRGIEQSTVVSSSLTTSLASSLSNSTCAQSITPPCWPLTCSLNHSGLRLRLWYQHNIQWRHDFF